MFKTIVHIDDDEDDRIFVKEAIKQYDAEWKVLEFNNGEEGLTYLKSISATCQLPSLVILDINMPKMNGKVVLKCLKEDSILSKIPVVLFTTSSSLLDRNYAEKEQVILLTKPHYLHDLVVAIHEIIKDC